MGRLRLPTPGISPIDEESEQSPPSNSSMINSEITAVLAVMRRNVRWSGRYSSDDLDHSLIHSLKSLRRDIFSFPTSNWPSIDPSRYLRPFLAVIRSDETSAPITGVALSSLHKILSFEMFDAASAHADDAMHEIVDAVTSCRFEVTDPASEETVLMRILQVLLACMRSRAAAVVSDQHVCTVVNTCFRVVHQAGTKGELLQRISRNTMHELVRCVFSRLPEVSVSAGKVSSVVEV